MAAYLLKYIDSVHIIPLSIISTELGAGRTLVELDAVIVSQPQRCGLWWAVGPAFPLLPPSPPPPHTHTHTEGIVRLYSLLPLLLYISHVHCSC